MPVMRRAVKFERGGQRGREREVEGGEDGEKESTRIAVS